MIIVLIALCLGLASWVLIQADKIEKLKKPKKLTPLEIEDVRTIIKLMDRHQPIHSSKTATLKRLINEETEYDETGKQVPKNQDY